MLNYIFSQEKARKKTCEWKGEIAREKVQGRASVSVMKVRMASHTRHPMWCKTAETEKYKFVLADLQLGVLHSLSHDDESRKFNDK